MSILGFLWNDKKSGFSLIIEQRFKNTITISRPTMTQEVSQSWMKFSSHNEEKFIVFINETNYIDEINNLGSSWSLWVKSQWDVRMEAISRSYIRYNFKKKIDRIRDTIFELTGKIQELVNEIHCMKDSRYFKMLNQYVVDYPTFPVNLRFPIFSRSWRNAKPFSGHAKPQR